jgi:hypothetical protein
MWKRGGTRQATDDNMAHTLCILDDEAYTYTHSEYVILIAFPLLYWFRERAWMVPYK